MGGGCSWFPVLEVVWVSLFCLTRVAGVACAVHNREVQSSMRLFFVLRLMCPFCGNTASPPPRAVPHNRSEFSRMPSRVFFSSCIVCVCVWGGVASSASSPLPLHAPPAGFPLLPYCCLLRCLVCTVWRARGHGHDSIRLVNATGCVSLHDSSEQRIGKGGNAPSRRRGCLDVLVAARGLAARDSHL